MVKMLIIAPVLHEAQRLSTIILLNKSQTALVLRICRSFPKGLIGPKLK